MSLNKLWTIENKKKIANLCLNIGATVLMNCVLQFLCYPMFEKKLGQELNGLVLTLISIVSITAGSFGSAANYSRLVNENVTHPSNGDYNVLLLIGAMICATIGVIYMWLNSVLTPLTAILFAILLIFTVFRYYADVEYKIKTDFLKYFFFYVSISVGYILGIILFNISGYWAIAIILGEVLGVGFAFFTSTIFRKNLKKSKNFKIVVKSISFLLLSSVLENLTLNADRLILLTLVDGTAVTQYYVASLFGKVVALLTVPINSMVISYLIRYNGNLSKKLWLIFVGSSIVLGILAIFGCEFGSIIILPHLYDWFEIVKPILLPAICSQVFFFISSVLLVVLLRFYGEKKQFILNAIYGIVFFATCIIATYFFGLNGFVYASLAVNFLRFILVSLWGFFASKPPKIDLAITEEQFDKQVETNFSH